MLKVCCRDGRETVHNSDLAAIDHEGGEVEVEPVIPACPRDIQGPLTFDPGPTGRGGCLVPYRSKWSRSPARHAHNCERSILHGQASGSPIPFSRRESSLSPR